jgi:hypothetical protein
LASGLLSHIFPALFIRPSTTFVKELNRNDLVVVEIGVDRGYNAKSILSNLDVKRFYAVDPYMEPWSVNLSLARTGSEGAYEQAVKETRRWADKITFIKQTSQKASKSIPDGLDFVYIDGLHTYEMVKLELKLYYKKLKVGGVIGGHDLYGDFIGVARAVTEFATKHKKEVNGKDVDWWIVK